MQPRYFTRLGWVSCFCRAIYSETSSGENTDPNCLMAMNLLVVYQIEEKTWQTSVQLKLGPFRMFLAD